MPDYKGVDPIRALRWQGRSLALAAFGAGLLSLLLFGVVTSLLALVAGYVVFALVATLMRVGLGLPELRAKAFDVYIMFASVMLTAALLSALDL